ncbi:MAG: class B sortase [Bacilli bacterium]
MKKIKNIIIIILTSMLLFLSIYFLMEYYNIDKYDKFILNENEVPVLKEEIYENQITSLKEKYNNDDIVGTISINDTDFNTVVLQGKDNDYYLNHLPDKTYNINGSIFLDYRVNIDNSDKLLIFGHSSPNYTLPIMIIENYNSKEYFEAHPYIYISTTKKVRKYQIFSAYVEVSDWDYMKIKYKSVEEKLAHYQKLKNKSFYETNVDVNENDNILIVQTCSNLKEYSKYSKKYMLVIAKEVEI